MWSLTYITNERAPYLEDTDKKECYCTRKPHMYHRKCYRKWKVEVFWRKNPLQTICHVYYVLVPTLESINDIRNEIMPYKYLNNYITEKCFDELMHPQGLHGCKASLGTKASSASRSQLTWKLNHRLMMMPSWLRMTCIHWKWSNAWSK